MTVLVDERVHLLVLRACSDDNTDPLTAICIHIYLLTGKKQFVSKFNFTYRYIGDVLSINNPDFDKYLGEIYLTELEIKDTTESNTSDSFLDSLRSFLGRSSLYFHLRQV